MDQKTLLIIIGVTPAVLGTLAYVMGWLLYRKRKPRWLRHFRVLMILGWLMSIQVLMCYHSYMTGFDLGTSGLTKEEAQRKFFQRAPFQDLFHTALVLVAVNSPFLMLIGWERMEADKRLAAAQQGKGEPPPET